MDKKNLEHQGLITKGLTLFALMATATSAHAASINLCTGEVVKAMADGKLVKMWGYGLDATGSGDCAVTVPGPQINLADGDASLVVNLRNTLPVATSIMIPGLKNTVASAPVFFIDEAGRRRARSLVAETAPGATATYAFAARPGTFLYQSGSHPAVQVQMGLYGAVVENAATNQAYPGIGYDNQLVMLYSEVDPAMHDAVAGTADGLTAATYGTANGPSSMINYRARYYLVNGESYTATTNSIPVGNIGDRTLIRFLNAGLETHSMLLNGSYLDMVAEFGNVYPFTRNQYSVMLAAGQTRDAIFTPASAGDFALFDRMMNLTNNDAPGAGGLMSVLNVTSTGVVPGMTVADTAMTHEEVPININVLANDAADVDTATVAIALPAVHGVATVETNGTISYLPSLNFNGTDSFSYTVHNTAGDLSEPTAVSITVMPVNDVPVAVDDAYTVTTGSVNNFNVLANDSDVDGDPLSVSLTTGPGTGTASVNPDGSITYTAAAAGTDSFTYTVDDGTDTATATVTVTITEPVNQPPVAVDDYVTVKSNTGASNNFVNIIVLANDSDADGSLVASSVTVSVAPANGTATVNTDGSIVYTPRAGFRGADAFAYTVKDDAGAVSNTATVRVDVIR